MSASCLKLLLLFVLLVIGRAALELQNDRPNQDGIVGGWFDGELVVEHTDVLLRSSDFPKMKFNQFLMAPYWPAKMSHRQ